MKRVRLNANQVLARMKRGEVLSTLDYGKAEFPDGAQPGVGVLWHLVRDERILRPEHTTSIGAPYRLPPEPTPAPTPSPQLTGDDNA